MWLRWAVGAAIYLPRSCPSGCELHATPVGAGGCGTRGRLWHLWDCVVLAYLGDKTRMVLEVRPEGRNRCAGGLLTS